MHELLHLFFPWNCLACRSKIGPRGAVLGLCQDCARQLQPVQGSRCRRCAIPLPASAGERLCAACQQPRGPWQQVHAAWFYEGTLSQVARSMKFGRMAFLADELGHRMGKRYADELTEIDIVTYVPLHWRRRLSRRFDQAKRIADALAHDAELPCRRLLRRVRATPPQSRRSRRERLRGLSRAFQLRRPGAIRGRRLALVDDVVTTGATIDAASAALRRGGPKSIVVFAAARTPPPPAVSFRTDRSPAPARFN